MQSVVLLAHSRLNSYDSFVVLKFDLFDFVAGVKLFKLRVSEEDLLAIFIKEIDSTQAAILLITFIIEVE